MSVKLEKLISVLRDMQSVVLAYSGGVDSAFLLKVVKDSGIPAIAVTASSETMPASELRAARELAESIGAKHKVIRTDELENPLFASNPADRCFYCKDELFSKLLQIAKTEGYNTVIDGSNSDDLADRRPGRQAALKHQVRSPLVEAGFSKDEIREHSKIMGLSTWAKPSSPCLSSRFPYGVAITVDALKRVEHAEEFLKSQGFGELRVRSNNDTARIEVGKGQIAMFSDKDLRETVVRRLKDLGFKYITLDLEGFRSGNLNSQITKSD